MSVLPACSGPGLGRGSSHSWYVALCLADNLVVSGPHVSALSFSSHLRTDSSSGSVLLISDHSVQRERERDDGHWLCGDHLGESTAQDKI